MNRLQLLGKAAMTCSSSCEQANGAIVSRDVGGDTPHALFAPLHYERNYAYPLLVWLHGPGDDERQLQRIMPLVSMRNYVAVAPRGNSSPADHRPGHTWDDSPAMQDAAEQRVYDAIDAARDRFNIADHRIFLGGLECGGTTALRIALSNPHQFAGVMTIGGPMPQRCPALAPCLSGPWKSPWNYGSANYGSANCGSANSGPANSGRTLQILFAQGRDSQSYPVEKLCQDLRLCHSAGLSVTVRQYPCGDGLTQHMLHDIDLWMMEIVTGTPTGPQHPPATPVDSN